MSAEFSFLSVTEDVSTPLPGRLATDPDWPFLPADTALGGFVQMLHVPVFYIFSAAHERYIRILGETQPTIVPNLAAATQVGAECCIRPPMWFTTPLMLVCYGGRSVLDVVSTAIHEKGHKLINDAALEAMNSWFSGLRLCCTDLNPALCRRALLGVLSEVYSAIHVAAISKVQSAYHKKIHALEAEDYTPLTAAQEGALGIAFPLAGLAFRLWKIKKYRERFKKMREATTQAVKDVKVAVRSTALAAMNGSVANYPNCRWDSPA